MPQKWPSWNKLMCVFYVPYYSSIKGARDLSSACETDRADFTDWMSFLPSNLVEKISSNKDVLKPFISMETVRRQRFRNKCFNPSHLNPGRREKN